MAPTRGLARASSTDWIIASSGWDRDHPEVASSVVSQRVTPIGQFPADFRRQNTRNRSESSARLFQLREIGFSVGSEDKPVIVESPVVHVRGDGIARRVCWADRTVTS